MRGLVDICEWRTSLEDLRKQPRRHKDMDNKVLQLLQLSYNRLNDIQLQGCFLHCALYAEGYVFPKDELVESWIRDGLMEKIESRHKQIDKGHTVINRLLEACLLEISFNTCVVKMHDVVRDMAVKAIRENHHFMIRAREQLRDLPCEEQWIEDLNKILLMRNEMKLIQPSDPPKCPNLQTFLLQDNWKLQQISDSFFSHMKGLMYLDFTDCRDIRRLPDSISNLENLRALVLRHCWALTYVPSLVKLRKLKELDLSWCSKLEDAPDGMEELVNLRYLNIMDSEKLVLRWDCLSSKLPNLEDLRLEPSINNIMAKDLMKLEKLERLEGWWVRDIQDLNSYAKSLHPYQLKHYGIVVGPNLPSPFGLERCLDRTMHIIGYRPSEEILVLPCDLQELIMVSSDFGGVRSLVDLGVPSLDGLTILSLWNAANLKALAMGGVLLPSSLKELGITECHEIKQMFSANQILPNLKRIHVRDCDALEEIFGGLHPDKNIKVIKLPKLTLLELSALPRLRSICDGGLPMACDSIQSIYIFGCWELKTLPLVVHSPLPSLRIRAERRWWEALQWEWEWEGNNSPSKHVLQPFV
ncbi:hypothetical protein Ancab_040664 [Ancistrocladus abbreviatus]